MWKAKAKTYRFSCPNTQRTSSKGAYDVTATWVSQWLSLSVSLRVDNIDQCIFICTSDIGQSCAKMQRSEKSTSLAKHWVQEVSILCVLNTACSKLTRLCSPLQCLTCSGQTAAMLY